MAINISGNPNRRAHGVSLAFAVAIVALVLGVLVAFYLSRGGAPPPTYKPEQLSTNGVNPNWYKRSFRTPVPTPSVAPMRASAPPPQPVPHVFAPVQQPYRPVAAATPNIAAQERTRALIQAMSSGIDVKIDGTNVLEMPQKDPEQVAVNTRAAPPHTLLAWSFIYASLETPIDSDHSGDVLAKVSHAARDITQTEVLIPVGSLIHGTQQGTNAGNYNDKALTVVFDDIEFPNGAHLPVPKLDGMDEVGSPGVSGQFDRHLAELWAPALLTSAVSAGIMLAQNPTYGSFQGYGGTQAASGAFASNLGGFATRGLNSEVTSIRPTITIPAGTPIRILVNRNFVFPAPYEG